MYIIQRNQEPAIGYSSSPEDLFAAAGMVKTGEFGVEGNRLDAPAEEQPVVEEEPEQVNEEQPVAPVLEDKPKEVNIEEILNGKFGDKFKSLDEIEAKLSEYESKVNTDPFANDFVRNLNKALKDGVDPEIYMQVSNINVDTLSEREAIVLQMQWKKNLSKEDAEFLVDRTYKLDPDSEPDPTDPEVREAQIKLRIDAKEAKEFLSSYKNDALTSPVEKRQAEINQAWEPVVPTLVEKYSTRTVQTKTGTYNIPASPEAMAAAKELLSEVVKSGMMDNMPDKEGLAVAEAIIEKEIIKQDFQRTIDYIADTLKQKQLEEKHNPRKPDPKATPVAAAEDGLINFLKQATGTR